MGGYFELSYSMSHYLALSLGFEVNDAPPDPRCNSGLGCGNNSMFVHIEVPKLGPWNFLATYQRRNAATFDARKRILGPFYVYERAYVESNFLFF